MKHIYKYNILKDTTILEFLKSCNLGIHKINQLVNSKKIRLNKEFVKFDDLIKKGSTIYIDFSDYERSSKDIEPFNYHLNVIYEDDYVLIIDKPSGFAIYDETNNSCIDNMVKNYYLENNKDNFVYHVHRLDKETSGLLLYAKDLLTLSKLNKDLEDGKLNRIYHAKVLGKVKKSGIIESYLSKDRHINNKMIVSPNDNGDFARLNYRLIKYNEDLDESKISVKLDTGRLHQIRVQMASIDHPILNDSLYNEYFNGNGFDKLQLISYEIEFIHPFTFELLNIKLNRDL